ncbi:hypothetical protein FJ567_08695 [Mesorhizobium sp. B2-4-16]|nr:hypothetical protein FJ567_08695 [Mesorhizobium sp. B2-4-16]TPL78153.1 hypothetical protein FJ956_00975 [Mesorhizobium sp. B2-4-3]
MTVLALETRGVISEWTTGTSGHDRCCFRQEAIREKFEERHPIGTAARICYALGFWLGNRH